MVEPASTTVIVPVRNGASTLGDTLAALDSQLAIPSQTEIIVVDNGSSDTTCDIARRHPVTLLEESIRGVSAARNRGLREGTGEVVAVLDADTVPSRRWLSEIIQPFTDPEVLIVAGETKSYPPETPAERYADASSLHGTGLTTQLRPFPFAEGMNMAVRRSAALEIGGWSEEMLKSDDIDFSYRLLQRFQTQIVYQPSAVLLHRHRTDDDSLWDQAWGYGQGAAHMYLRYPDVVSWDIGKASRVKSVRATRSAAAFGLTAASLLHRGWRHRASIARYHSGWTRWFWRGFRSYYRDGVYSPRAT